MRNIRLLVAGGREYFNDVEMDRVLSAIHRQKVIAKLIHGDAPGADRMSGGWANLNYVEVAAYPIGKEDGFIPGRAPARRNQRMFDDSRPDMGVFFPGGPGTRDMFKRCFKKIPCLVGIYTGGAMRTQDNQWVQFGPSTIGWKLYESH